MSTTEVVFGLIGTNVAVYYLWHYVDAAFMAKHFMVNFSLTIYLAISHSLCCQSWMMIASIR